MIVIGIFAFLIGVGFGLAWQQDSERPGLPRWKNPPTPPKRSEQWVLAKHHGLYQPDNKVDTSNPPKETGT